MPRLLFEKTGNAVFISHLDLMRLFQRAFKRAGLPLTHTHGFNPRPSVSIALPMSVGVESRCELLDFDLEGEKLPCADILQRLNEVLIDGVHGLQVYEDGQKIKNLSYLDCLVTMEYDRPIAENAIEQIENLFRQDEVLVEKKGKNGVSEQNIAPMIRHFSIKQGEGQLIVAARVCCQNPTLNPAQLVVAVEKYLPALKPDFAQYTRIEIYDTDETIFR